MQEIIPIEHIENKIVTVRNQKVMLDRDLAELYEVETKVLKRAVRRNIDRFPNHFMFEITKDEYDSLRSHFGTLKRGEHSKYLPFAFTVYGVTMLPSVLNSEKAKQINIRIVETFINYVMQRSTYDELRKAIYSLDLKLKRDIEYISTLLFHEVDRLEQMIKPKKQIGFKKED